MRTRVKRKNKFGGKLLAAFLVTLLALAGWYAYAEPAGLPWAKAAPPEAPALRTAPAVPMPAQPAGGAFATAAEGDDEAFAIDLGPLEQGYILVRAATQRQVRLVVEKDGGQYVHPLPADGEYHAFPLTMGDGDYLVHINAHAGGRLYDRMLEVPFTAAGGDPFSRFLVPNPMADYGPDSAAVQVARRLYTEAGSDAEFVQAAFEWVQANLSYDDESAPGVPDLERIVEEGKAVCSGYASVFAAMLRSCGIPCQVVYGNVETQREGPRYHAWNLVWLADESAAGWQLYDATLGYGPQSPPLVDVPQYGQPQRIY